MIIIKLKRSQGSLKNIAGSFVDFNGIEISALGGEIELAVVMGYAASYIAGIRHGKRIRKLAGFLIQRKQRSVSGYIAAFAVVGSDEEVVFADIGFRPVVTALFGIGPSGELGFFLVVGVFVGYGDANVVAGFGFTAPKSGVDITVVVGNGAVGLTAANILVNPKRFKGVCVEGLNSSVVETYKEHTVGIGGRNNGKGRVGNHLCGGNDFAAYFVDLKEVGACIAVDVIVHDYGRAGCAGAVTVADFLCPIKDGVVCGGGRLVGYNAVVVGVIAERRPLRKKLFEAGFRRSFKRYGNCFVRLGGIRNTLAYIAACGYDAGVGLPFYKRKSSAFVQNSLFGAVGHKNHCGRRRDIEADGNGVPCRRRKHLILLGGLFSLRLGRFLAFGSIFRGYGITAVFVEIKRGNICGERSYGRQKNHREAKKKC